MKRRILVVGGVAAGPSAAAKAKRVNPDTDVVLFEQGEHISYGVCEIPFFIGNEITDASTLIIYSPEQFQKEKDVAVRTLHRVSEIHSKKKEIIVHNLRDGKKTIEVYDKLILATGNSSKKIIIEGEQCRNVFHIKSLAEACSLKKYLDEEKPRTAVVIGAGFIGVEMIDALTRRGIDVTLISKSLLPLSNLGKEQQKLLVEEIVRNNVRFIPETTVEWFGVGAKQNVVAVGTKQLTIETDLVIIAIGVEPNALLAKESGIHTGTAGGILVNEKMNALGADNIFAAGDCCELKNIITNKPMYQSLATTASRTGWIAGENAAGGNVKFSGTLRAIGVRVFGMEAAQAGLSEREAQAANFQPITNTIQTLSQVGMMPGVKKISITTVADKKNKKILGASLLGGEGAIARANIFAVAIRHGLTIDEIAELDLVYSPPFSPLWDGVTMSGIQMKKKL